MYSLLTILLFIFMCHCALKIKSITFFFVLGIPTWYLFFTVFCAEVLNSPFVFSENLLWMVFIYLAVCKVLIVIKGAKILFNLIFKKGGN